jgi:hypothetical protein
VRQGSESNIGAYPICRSADAAIGPVQQPRLLEGRDIRVDAPILPSQRACECGYRRFGMLVQMTQQTIPFARQYCRKGLPTLKCKYAFPDLSTAFGAMPRVDESSSVILNAAAHHKSLYQWC